MYNNPGHKNVCIGKIMVNVFTNKTYTTSGLWKIFYILLIGLEKFQISDSFNVTFGNFWHFHNCMIFGPEDINKRYQRIRSKSTNLKDLSLNKTNAKLTFIKQQRARSLFILTIILSRQESLDVSSLDLSITHQKKRFFTDNFTQELESMPVS